PSGGEQRWRVLGHVALADAVMDFAVAAVMERRRPEGLRSTFHIERAIAKIRRGLDGLAKKTKRGEFHMGSIATAVALEYLDYRHADINWRDEHGALAAWLDAVAQRHAFQSTRPQP
ncbi:MAG TPA: glutathione S-transferase C-terminal domain-containing protein, partial [Magnetovibrio sp.]